MLLRRHSSEQGSRRLSKHDEVVDGLFERRDEVDRYYTLAQQQQVVVVHFLLVVNIRSSPREATRTKTVVVEVVGFLLERRERI